MDKKTNNSKKETEKDEVLFAVPLFAKYLESQKESSFGTNKRNDDINTPKYPYDNSDISNVNPNMQVIGIKTTNKKNDTIYTTLKYPSDSDEYITMKYPSDADEAYKEISGAVPPPPSETQMAVLEKATNKWPSDQDDDDTTSVPTDEQMIQLASNKPKVTLKYPSDSEDVSTTKPTIDYVQTMKYPSDTDEPRY